MKIFLANQCTWGCKILIDVYLLAIMNAPQGGSSEEVFSFLKLLSTFGNPAHKYALQVLHLLRPFKLDENIIKIIKTANIEDVELLFLMMDREKSQVITYHDNTFQNALTL